MRKSSRCNYWYWIQLKFSLSFYSDSPTLTTYYFPLLRFLTCNYHSLFSCQLCLYLIPSPLTFPYRHDIYFTPTLPAPKRRRGLRYTPPPYALLSLNHLGALWFYMHAVLHELLKLYHFCCMRKYIKLDYSFFFIIPKFYSHKYL